MVGEHLFIYLGFNVSFNTVLVISQRVVLGAEETRAYVHKESYS